MLRYGRVAEAPLPPDGLALNAQGRRLNLEILATLQHSADLVPLPRDGLGVDIELRVLDARRRVESDPVLPTSSQPVRQRATVHQRFAGHA